MTTGPRSPHREFEVDDHFGRLARSPGGMSRNAALARAAAEIERVKPQIAEQIKEDCKRLEAALRAAGAAGGLDATSVSEAHAISQQLRDVAETVGYALVGLIASNLCIIFDALEAGRIDYPAAVIECHFSALRLALSRRYQNKSLKDLPELSAGLMQIVQIAKEQTGQDLTATDLTPIV